MPDRSEGNLHREGLQTKRGQYQRIPDDFWNSSYDAVDPFNRCPFEFSARLLRYILPEPPPIG